MTAPQLPKAELVGEGMSRGEWLEARKPYIGGSEIAAVLGISRFASPLSLYLRKRGEVEEEQRESEPMRWGEVLEQPIADEFSRRVGLITYQPPPLTLYRSVECDVASASPDRLVMSGDRLDDVTGWLEVKNFGGHREDELDDGLPLETEAQAQWECAVSGLPVTHVAILVGNRRFHTFEVFADPTLQADLFARATVFMEDVREGRQPAADAHRATTEALKRRFARSESSSIELPSDAAWEIQQLIKSRALLAEMKADVAGMENRLRQRLGVHEAGTINGEVVVTAKTSTRKEHFVPASTYRSVRPTKEGKSL